MVAFGLTTESTRAFRICVRYCDCSAGFLSCMTKIAKTKKTASDAVPVHNKRRIVHHAETSLSRSRDRLVLSRTIRSEEHTSELQSPYDLVCRLLLEKKK